MEQILAIAGVAGLFVLRLGVPLAIVVIVGYVLHRLDAKWEAQAGLKAASLANSLAAECPFAGQTDPVCWVARRLLAEGHVAAECHSCSQFGLRKVA